MSTRVKNPEIFQRPYNRLVEHSQKIHRDRFGRFASPGRGQAVTLNFPVRHADTSQREFSNSSTPERETPQEPDVDVSPVRDQADTQNIRELGTPPVLNISALSDNQGDTSRESGAVNEKADITGEAITHNTLRRSRRIPTVKRTHIPGAVIYT